MALVESRRTKLTNDVYPKLLGPYTTTAEQRLKLDAYLLAGLTEFWRAYRHYAAVDHFVYLTGCEPEGFTQAEREAPSRTTESEQGYHFRQVDGTAPRLHHRSRFAPASILQVREHAAMPI
jgi:hypothetical protein